MIDTTGNTRGIAPPLIGYQTFEPNINIAGVILNKTGGSRHETKLRTAVQTHTIIPVLGAVGRTEALDIGERHLGLTTPAETGELDDKIRSFGEIVAQSVDLDALLDISRSAPPFTAPPTNRLDAKYRGIRIGIAQNASFGFYYADDLEAFQALGATLIPFDNLQATTLPDIDGQLIGRGFPEVKMIKLAANTALRKKINRSIQAGLPTYAECGSLMCLCDTLACKGITHPMCAVVPGHAVMQDRPQGRGYTRYQDTINHPWWPSKSPQPAHEFHYARIDNLNPKTMFARKIQRGHSTDGKHDGIVMHNLLAGFCHLRNTRENPWVANFLAFVAARKSRQY